MDSDVQEILSGGLQRIESGKKVELAQGEYIFPTKLPRLDSIFLTIGHKI